MGLSHYILLAALFAICASQRSPYAGRRPIGFPVIETSTLPAASAQTDSLGNRVGEDQSTTSTTTQRLPVEALGNRDLVNRLGKLPQAQQPFWFVNWQQLEQNRNSPQSYPLRPSYFADSLTFPVDNTPARSSVNTQQPLPNNQQQSLTNTQPPVQGNQGVLNNQQQPLSNTQLPVQDNQQQPISNTQFPLQDNQQFLNNQQQQIPNTQFAVRSNQVNSQQRPFLNPQIPVQSNQGFLNTQQRSRNDDDDDDDEFDYE